MKINVLRSRKKVGREEVGLELPLEDEGVRGDADVAVGGQGAVEEVDRAERGYGDIISSK